MKNAKIALTSLLSLALVGEAQAQTDYDGSDTLGPIINALVQSSGANINYLEQGSGFGEDAMVAGTQQTAPMSSPLSSEVCNANSGARQVVVGIDKLLVTRNNGGNDGSCDTSLTVDVGGYTSGVPAWAEVLQLVYGGDQGAGTSAACSATVRADLISNWGNLWDNACANGSCTALRFAFRRGDGSGTTKVFKNLVGIDDFYNGTQADDNDPIRTPCGNDVDWCPASGDIGVVQAIDIPKDFPQTARIGCATGAFDFAFDTGSGCADGSPPFAGFLCAYPQDCKGRFGCVNGAFNGSPLNPFMDGRDYNPLLLDGNASPLRLPDTANPAALYFNGACTAGETGTNATLQIGCLVNQVDCSIGYGGNSQLEPEVTTTDPGDACDARNAVANVAASANGLDLEDANYPLARNLYINTLAVPVSGDCLDCSAITNADERTLCEAVCDPAQLEPAVVGAGFAPLAGGATSVVNCGD